MWTAERSADWRKRHGWICGFNYVPSSAVNTTAMWQADTFDAGAIERELGWAARIGLNSCRVFLQYLVWEADPEAYLDRFAQFLGIAGRHGISVMPVLFDDCAFSGKQPYLGPQAAPAPGVHNSGWTPSPGRARVVDVSCRPSLEQYVTAFVSRFATEERVVAWDLYNEPGNGDMGDTSLPLLEQAFVWARQAAPEQPLTAGVWDPALTNLSEMSLALSDIVTFHSYEGLEALQRGVKDLAARAEGKPLVCTEWMARTLDSRPETHLPYFRNEHIGCYCWGLVKGRTQTHLPWGSQQGAPEPELWFHDLLHPDGAPYCDAEIALFQSTVHGAA